MLKKKKRNYGKSTTYGTSGKRKTDFYVDKIMSCVVEKI